MFKGFISWHRFLLGIGIGAEYPCGAVAASEQAEEDGVKKNARQRWLVLATSTRASSSCNYEIIQFFLYRHHGYQWFCFGCYRTFDTDLDVMSSHSDTKINNLMLWPNTQDVARTISELYGAFPLAWVLFPPWLYFSGDYTCKSQRDIKRIPCRGQGYLTNWSRKDIGRVSQPSQLLGLFPWNPFVSNAPGSW